MVAGLVVCGRVIITLEIDLVLCEQEPRVLFSFERMGLDAIFGPVAQLVRAHA